MLLGTILVKASDLSKRETLGNKICSVSDAKTGVYQSPDLMGLRRVLWDIPRRRVASASPGGTTKNTTSMTLSSHSLARLMGSLYFVVRSMCRTQRHTKMETQQQTPATTIH